LGEGYKIKKRISSKYTREGEGDKLEQKKRKSLNRRGVRRNEKGKKRMVIQIAAYSEPRISKLKKRKKTAPFVAKERGPRRKRGILVKSRGMEKLWDKGEYS